MEVDGPLQEQNSSAPLSAKVWATINDARLTYGLRHQDYQRYREHCTHRVRRLRKTLNLTQPNNKKQNVQKELPEKFNDSRYLYLYVYEVERSWAYAMELKQESTSSMNIRKKHHLIKRLKRASQHAEALYQLCQKQEIDNGTNLEIKAYSSLMKGFCLFEQQEWQQALECFVSARTIYDGFVTSSNEPQDEVLYSSAVNDIDPSIRFCAYKLRLGSGSAGPPDISNVITSMKTENAAEFEEIERQLAILDKESRKQKANTLAETTWRGKRLVARNDVLAQAVVRAQESSKKANSDTSLEAFDQVLSDWTDARKLLRKAMKQEKEMLAKLATSTMQRSQEDLNWLNAFIAYNHAMRYIQRNLKLADGVRKNGGKPQEMIKLYDGILENVESLRDVVLPKDDEGIFEWELDVLSQFYRCYRCLYVAMAYTDLQRTPEAAALYQLAQTYAVRTKQLIQSGQFDDSAIIKITTNDVSALENQLRVGSLKARASWYLANEQQDQDLSEQMEDLKLDTKDEEALIKRLDTYPVSLTKEGSKVPNLIEFPPRFEPVPCKPFFYDLAANHIQYPNELYARGGKSTGLFSKLFGFSK